MRFAASLSGIRDHIHASCSAPPSHTIPMALSIANSLDPTGTLTTFIPPSSAMRTPTAAKSDTSSGVGTCPFGGKASVLPGLRVYAPRCQFSLSRKGTAPTVPGDISSAATDSVAVEVCIGFDSLRLVFLPNPRKHRP